MRQQKHKSRCHRIHKANSGGRGHQGVNWHRGELDRHHNRTPGIDKSKLRWAGCNATTETNTSVPLYNAQPAVEGESTKGPLDLKVNRRELVTERQAPTTRQLCSPGRDPNKRDRHSGDTIQTRPILDGERTNGSIDLGVNRTTIRPQGIRMTCVFSPGRASNGRVVYCPIV